MKKILSFNFVLVALLTFTATMLTSCNLFEEWFDDEPTMPMLSASSDYVSFSPEDDSHTIFVNSNIDWTYEIDASWVHAYPNGRELKIIADENRSEKSRSCRLTLKAVKQNLAYDVKISQSSSLLTISADISELVFSSYDGAFNTIFIQTTGEWRVTKCPDWLRSSVTSSKGSKNVTLKTLSPNKASKPRTGEVVFSTADQDLRIAVSQDGSAASGCNVRPGHITTLSNGIAFDMDYSQAGNVAHYYRGYLEASRAGIMTNDEIIYTLKHEFQRHLPADDEVADFAGLKANTKYIIYTLAYNMDGKAGELIATEVKTDPVVTNEPCAWINDLCYDSSYWYWTITKSATCYSYFMMSTDDKSIGEASDVLQSWWLDDAIRRNQISEYFNGGEWYMPRSSNVVAIWTRGKSSNGIWAGKISWEGGAISNGSRAKSATTPVDKNREGDHSGRKLRENEYKLYLVK